MPLENPPRTDPVHRLRLTLLAIFCLTHKTKIIMTLSKLAFGRDFLYIVLSSWLTLRDNVSMEYIIALDLPSIIKENLLE